VQAVVLKSGPAQGALPVETRLLGDPDGGQVVGVRGQPGPLDPALAGDKRAIQAALLA